MIALCGVLTTFFGRRKSHRNHQTAHGRISIQATLPSKIAGFAIAMLWLLRSRLSSSATLRLLDIMKKVAQT
jgi:hypothetical protein